MLLTGETEVLGENLSQCHFDGHKCHKDWLRNQCLHGDRRATNRLCHGYVCVELPN